MLLILATAIGCSPGADSDIPPADVVATFEGGQITRDDLLRAGQSIDTNTLTESGTPSSDWRIEAINDIAFRRTLASQAAPSPQHDLEIEQRRLVALVELMEERLGWNALTVDEDEMRRQFDAHPEQYRDPEKIRVQHIFLGAEVGESSFEEREAVRTRLEGIREQLISGADFTALVREHSQSSTAGRGGWLGLKRGDGVDPNFSREAWALELNEISDIVDTPRGFHVLVVRERHPAVERQFEEVREFARKRALTEKRIEIQQRFVEEVGPQYELQKNYELLEDPFAADDAALLTAGDFRFTIADLKREIPVQYREHLSNGYLPRVHEFLDRVALNRVLILEGESQGVSKSPEMAQAGAAIAEEVLFQAALELRLQAKVSALPEGTMREYFQQNRERYKTLRGTDLSLIFLPPGDNLWKTLEQGRELVERIRNGESFEDLARQYSRHRSARNGGVMRGLNDNLVTVEVQSGARFRRTFDALEDGEVADAMVAECYDPDTLRFVPTGVIVFRRDHVTEPVPQPYEVAEVFVRGNYQRRNHQRLVKEIRDEVIDEINLEVYEENLPGV